MAVALADAVAPDGLHHLLLCLIQSSQVEGCCWVLTGGDHLLSGFVVVSKAVDTHSSQTFAC